MRYDWWSLCSSPVRRTLRIQTPHRVEGRQRATTSRPTLSHSRPPRATISKPQRGTTKTLRTRRTQNPPGVIHRILQQQRHRRMGEPPQELHHNSHLARSRLVIPIPSLRAVHRPRLLEVSRNYPPLPAMAFPHKLSRGLAGQRSCKNPITLQAPFSSALAPYWVSWELPCLRGVSM